MKLGRVPAALAFPGVRFEAGAAASPGAGSQQAQLCFHLAKRDRLLRMTPPVQMRSESGTAHPTQNKPNWNQIKPV